MSTSSSYHSNDEVASNGPNPDDYDADFPATDIGGDRRGKRDANDWSVQRPARIPGENLGRVMDAEAEDEDEDEEASVKSGKRVTINLTSPDLQKKSNKRRESIQDQLTARAIEHTNLLDGKQYSSRTTSRSSSKGDKGGSKPSTIFEGDDKLQAPQTIMVGTSVIKIRKKPKEATAYSRPKRFYSHDRDGLSLEDKSIFLRSALNPVLFKGNKLTTMTICQDNDDLLIAVKNLQSQLKTLYSQMYQHDLDQIFTILSPLGPDDPRVSETTFNLFTDYATLHPAQVAASTAYYNNWTDESCSWITDNLDLTIDAIRVNCDPDLFAKATEDHEEFDPVCQGGPLLLYFVLKRILDVSEQSIVYIVNRVKALNLSKIPGEDVEAAVSIIKATHKVLKQCSTSERNFVPENIEELVLRVFQTTSSDVFNDTFKYEEQQGRREADKFGGIAKFSSVSELCSLAINTYRRLTGPGEDYKWVCASSKTSAFNAGVKTRSYDGAGGNSGGKEPPKPHGKSSDGPPCYNCGKHGCKPSICEMPKNQDRIDAAKAIYDKSKEKSGGGGRKHPPKDSKGRPQQYNRHGALIVDQRAYKAQLGKSSKGNKSKRAKSKPKTSEAKIKTQLDALVSLLDSKQKAADSADEADEPDLEEKKPSGYSSELTVQARSLQKLWNDSLKK